MQNESFKAVNYIDSIRCDAPEPWGLFFQDNVSDAYMEGLEELHNNIMFYLAAILFAVSWIIVSIILNVVSRHMNPSSLEWELLNITPAYLLILIGLMCVNTLYPMDSSFVEGGDTSGVIFYLAVIIITIIWITVPIVIGHSRQDYKRICNYIYTIVCYILVWSVMGVIMTISFASKDLELVPGIMKDIMENIKGEFPLLNKIIGELFGEEFTSPQDSWYWSDPDSIIIRDPTKESPGFADKIQVNYSKSSVGTQTDSSYTDSSTQTDNPPRPSNYADRGTDCADLADPESFEHGISESSSEYSSGWSSEGPGESVDKGTQTDPVTVLDSNSSNESTHESKSDYVDRGTQTDPEIRSVSDAEMETVGRGALTHAQILNQVPAPLPYSDGSIYPPESPVPATTSFRSCYSWFLCITERNYIQDVSMNIPLVAAKLDFDALIRDTPDWSNFFVHPEDWPLEERHMPITSEMFHYIQHRIGRGHYTVNQTICPEDENALFVDALFSLEDFYIANRNFYRR